MAPHVLMVAEKPSIALSIASVLSNGRMSTRKSNLDVHEFDGKFLGQDVYYKVTSVIGHVFSQLLEKSLIEANVFIGKHEDSLMHRAAAAEMLYLLESSKKSETIKLIEDSTNNLVPKCADRYYLYD